MHITAKRASPGLATIHCHMIPSPYLVQTLAIIWPRDMSDQLVIFTTATPVGHMSISGDARETVGTYRWGQVLDLLSLHLCDKSNQSEENGLQQKFPLNIQT